MVAETSPRRWLEEAALNRRWFDVLIFAGGKQYRAHKIILSSASVFLRGILLSRSTDEYTCIVLADVTSEIVELLLQYVYTGEVSLLQEQVEAFIALARVLQLHIDKEVLSGNKEKLIGCEGRGQHLPTNNNHLYAPPYSTVKDINHKEHFKIIKVDEPDAIKYEKDGPHKNFDVEVLIKSDKISKCSMSKKDDSPAVRPRDPNKLGDFYKNMQYLRKAHFEPKDSISICEEKKLIDSDRSHGDNNDSHSTSSCEVVDPTSDSSPCHRNARSDTATFRQSVRHDFLSPSKSPNTNSSSTISGPLNLMHYLQRSPDSQNSVTERLYRSLIDRRDKRVDGVLQAANNANHRLIKPIPSLMPIDRLVPGLDPKTFHSSSSPLLDLTTVRNKLNINVHSAFEQVRKTSRQSRLTYDYHISNLNNGGSGEAESRLVPKSFSDPFQSDIIGPVSNEDHPHFPAPFRSEIRHQPLESKSRILPRNSVISGPWCSRSPTFYKPARKSLHSPEKVLTAQRDFQEVTTPHHNISPHSITVAEHQPVLEKSNIVNIITKSNLVNIHERTFNDSNNNFETINCNSVADLNVYGNSGDGYRTHEGFQDVNKFHSSKHFTAYSPRSVSVTSSREDDAVFKIPEDDFRSVVDIRPTDKYNRIIDPFPIAENIIEQGLCVKSEVNDSEHLVLKCEFCSKVFTSKESLAVHSGSHSSRARYKCEQCDKCFSQLRNYKYHVSVHRGTKEFAATCNVCGKYFNDRGYLSSHMKIHRNRKEYQCPHCPKSFNQRVAYNMHVRIHTGIKPHQCEECGKAFSRKMLLKQHARTHSGEKPYACASCGKKFADRSNMTLHMRLHSGVKPFSCTLCPKSFTKKHHLKTHLNYHTGNKPYACVKCGLTFSQSSNMRTHMKKCTSLEATKTSEVQQAQRMQAELMAT